MKKLSLSSAGEKRRADMRGQLQKAFARHHRIRKLQKVVAATCAVCAVIAATSFLFWWGDAEVPNQRLAKSSQNSGSEQVKSEYQHISVEYISDQQLSDMLKDVGEPWIIAKVNGKAMAIPCRRNAELRNFGLRFYTLLSRNRSPT